jgi:hypothetical protein
MRLCCAKGGANRICLLVVQGSARKGQSKVAASNISQLLQPLVMAILNWANLPGTSTGGGGGQYAPSTKLESVPEHCQLTSSHNSDPSTQVNNTETGALSEADASDSLLGVDDLSSDRGIDVGTGAPHCTGTTLCSLAMLKVGLTA